MANIFYTVPMIEQGNNPICWIACVAMIKSFKTQSMRSISEFTNGAEPSSSCVNGTEGSNDGRLAKLGFTVTGANMSINSTYIEDILRKHGPFIMFFFVANFPFTGASCLKMDGSPSSAHAVVINGLDTDARKVKIVNPWGTNTPPADQDVIIRLMQDYADKGLNPVAYMN